MLTIVISLANWVAASLFPSNVGWFSNNYCLQFIDYCLYYFILNSIKCKTDYFRFYYLSRDIFFLMSTLSSIDVSVIAIIFSSVSLLTDDWWESETSWSVKSANSIVKLFKSDSSLLRNLGFLFQPFSYFKLLHRW